MPYLFYKQENENKAFVELIYYQQPESVQDVLLNYDGYLIKDEIPKEEYLVGKISKLYCNPQTGELWYEYVDRPLTSEEIANQKLVEQQAQIDELTLMLGDMILGGIE